MLAISRFKERIQSIHIKAKANEHYKVLHTQNAYYDLFLTIAEIRKDEPFLQEGLAKILEKQYLETVYEAIKNPNEEKNEQEEKELEEGKKSVDAHYLVIDVSPEEKAQKQDKGPGEESKSDDQEATLQEEGQASSEVQNSPSAEVPVSESGSSKVRHRSGQKNQG